MWMTGFSFRRFQTMRIVWELGGGSEKGLAISFILDMDDFIVPASYGSVQGVRCCHGCCSHIQCH